MIDAAVTAAAEPVPSVLPEEGIDLAAELERYRMWFVEQALIRTQGNISRAGQLLGYSPNGMYQIIRRRATEGRSFRRGGARPREKQEAAAAPAEPPADPAPAAPKPATGLAARIDWAEVERLRALGLRDHQVAQRLTWSVGSHKWAIEKLLKAQRESRP